MPWVSFTIAAPLVAAALCPFLPRTWPGAPRLLALAGTAGSAAGVVVAWARFDSARGMQLVEHARWIPTLDVSWRVGVDGMSLALSALTVLLFVVSILYGVGPRPLTRAAAGLLLLLEGATLAFFLAADFLVFYVAFDVTLVAMYFLIALWGEEHRRYAALKFFLYTLIGSLPVLLGIIALYLTADPHTFDMTRLTAEHPLAGGGVGG
jgi:NADH-quinone oxidoreductase subunit M